MGQSDHNFATSRSVLMKYDVKAFLSEFGKKKHTQKHNFLNLEAVI